MSKNIAVMVIAGAMLMLWGRSAASAQSVSTREGKTVDGKKSADLLAGQRQMREVPKFQVDQSWRPKFPNNWILGWVSGVNVDAKDHIWIIHRPRTLKPEQQPMAAPPVLELDADGNFIQGWGGPGKGYEWPGTEHGLSIDYKGNVWIGGSNFGGGAEPGSIGDDQILKFTNTGKFLMQIGHSGQSKGNTDRQNVHGATDITVYPKTNEAFVADGYGNRRVIVFDADTGAFRRMWGAFGNVPTDPPPGTKFYLHGGTVRTAEEDKGLGATQFSVVHSARISNDGLVYVSDRAGQRLQVFTLQGKYLKQVFLDRGRMPDSTLPGMAFGRPIRELADEMRSDAGYTVSRTAFSPDPQQRFLYVANYVEENIAIYDRKTLELLGTFGDGPGSAPGAFFHIHDIAADSKGNIYTAEVNKNMRAQKFAFVGTSTVSTK